MVRFLRQNVERIAAIIGAGFIVAGVVMIHPPSALVVAGLLLLAGALWRR